MHRRMTYKYVQS